MKTPLNLTCALLTSAAAFAAVLSHASPAAACGGTFCDGNAMPVDQTGENILFVMGGDFTEAHIQIQYNPDTDAGKFAWVVPLLALPEFSVGSDPLFDNLLQSTVPSYGFTTQFTCEGETSGGAFSTGGEDGGSAGDTGASGDGPDVVHQETVGAFEITVLQGGSAQEVMTWLNDNGYQQDPDAEPILQQYLDENYLFAAFKLTTNAEVSEIHPVTLRFPNDEACVPLRLTRIAAQDDMDVRTFFLADHRVVPQTYKHVVVNPLKLDWPNFASNYKEVITLAVDADQANGKAFVTEYAASSNVVNRFGIWQDTWNSETFAAIEATQVVTELANQNFLWCDSGGFNNPEYGFCEFFHPLIQGLLQRYLPAPEGVDEMAFYGCLECYADQIDATAWDSAAFSADLQARIIAPGKHASDLLDTWPTLTRMYTTISPFEMTTDPFFHQNPDLPEVDFRSQVATQNLDCNGDAVWVLPDGREVFVPAGGSWPEFSEEMPWEEEVQETPQAGAPMPLVDNTDAITAQLAMHNCQYGYPSSEACGGIGSTGGDTDSGGDTDGVRGESAGASESEASGCGCTTTSNRTGLAWSLLALMCGAGLRSRRRR